MSACVEPRLFVRALLVVSAVALALAGCQSATTSTGPSPLKCQIVINPPGAFGAAGGPGSFTVTAAPECAWNASTRDGWISSLDPASGQGGADIRFQVAPNQSSRARQGEIALGEVVARIGQSAASCALTLGPRSEAVASGGGTGTVTVTTLADCGWIVTNDVPWLSITSGTSGTGSGTVTFSADSNAGSARVGTFDIAGQSFTVTQDAPGVPGAQCVYSIQPAAHAAAAGGGTAQVAVTAPAQCSWTAASNESWLAIAGAPTGVGIGTVAFTAAVNAGSARTGTLTIAGQTVTVSQAGSCAASITPASASMGAGGGPGPAVTVSMAAGCAWTAVASGPWLTITSAPSGTGSGTVAFTAAANAGSARTGTLTIAGQTVTVSQAGSCAASITPTSASMGAAGGPGPAVTVSTAASCAWTAAASDPWLTITSAPNGTGSGTVAFTAAVNAGSARTGTVTIAGQTFTVSQAGSCAASITPTGASMGAGGGPGPDVTVSTTAGCAWTATASDPWLTITSAPNGTGSGTVAFAAAANAASARTGTLTIAGQTFTVTQAGSCAASITPASASMGAGGGPGPDVTVSTAAGCVWTATASDPWLTITSAPNGTGSGTVAFTAAVNAGSARTGTLTIAGQTFTVTQAAAVVVACTYAIDHNQESFDEDRGTSKPVTVTTTAGCSWTAVSNDSWITVRAGASGLGSGTVTFSVARNRNSNDRQGTLTIAGHTFHVTQEGDD